jgi:hypothetical protein
MQLGVEGAFGLYRGWRERLEEQAPALDRDSTIAHALSWANTGSIRDYRAIMRGIALPSGECREPESWERQAFRAALTSIIEKSATSSQRGAWISTANELVKVVRYRLSGTVIRVESRYQQFGFSSPLSPRLALVLLWFIDPAEIAPGRQEMRRQYSLGELLKQCDYSKCRRFSIAQPTGKQGQLRMSACDLADTAPDDHKKLAENERRRPKPPRHK